MAHTINALIIDDDAFNLEVLQRMVASEGGQPVCVQDVGKLDAVLRERGTQLDIAFLDLEMPKMDGYRVFEMLRSRLGADFPVVACTVHTNEITNARSLGFHSFVGKPIDLERFPDQFRRILSGEPVWEI
jgi:two-component system, cell cycle response regulator DivK